MSDPYQRRILQHVSHSQYEPRRLTALSEELGVDKADVPAFEKSIAKLVSTGQVVLGVGETVALPPLGREIVGRVHRHERGFGFICPEEPTAHGDLFVPAIHMGGAMTGDTVRAEVHHRPRRGGPPGHSPYTGKIIEIVQRARNVFTGTLGKRGNFFVVQPDGRTLTDPIVVHDAESKNARVGDKVAVELTQYPEENYLPEGVITKVLGEAGEPDTETEAIIHAFNLPKEFPDAVVDEARKIVSNYSAKLDRYLEDRLDLRDTFIITIDPPDAKDYDDAISIVQTDRGIELGVHIADVAAFVTEGSALDEEARLRSNSCYLPRRVIPMLPEVLSNGICSLQPGVPRLARSAFITYDDDANPISTRFARTVIHSAHRLTYLEAQSLIDGDPETARKHAKTDKPHTKQLIEHLQRMNSLAQAIRNRRLHKGMIVLDLPEVELIHDDSGRVVDAQPEDNAFTHKVIEAFMVEANEAVARVFADLGVPLIRRVHPEPGAHDVSELRAFANIAGFQIPQNPTRKELQKLLESVRGTPAAKAVHFAVLRTLTKAEYSPDLIGHFALASEHYTHFTSPIRRYADLLVHRAMDALQHEIGSRAQIPKGAKQRKILANRLRSDDRILGDVELAKIGRLCSDNERRAEAAERELRNLLVMQLLESHVGEDFAGTVTGVTGFGVFVQIDKYLVEGMIRTDDLPGGPAERWSLNKFTGSLVSQRSGRSITIGDQFTIRINQIDLPRREMSLLIVSELPAVRSNRNMKQNKMRADSSSRRKPHKTKRNKGGRRK